MDLSILQSLTPNVAAFFHLAPETLLAWLIFMATLANIIGRLIPDDKTGPLGAIRETCKILGLYVGNRVTSGVTVNDVAKSIVKPADPVVEELASASDTLIPDVVEQVVPAFPGLPPRGPDGKFIKASDVDNSKALMHWATPILAVVIALSMGGCAMLWTGLTAIGNATCKNESTVRPALEAALYDANNEPDPAKRAEKIRSAQVGLNALDACHATG